MDFDVIHALIDQVLRIPGHHVGHGVVAREQTFPTAAFCRVGKHDGRPMYATTVRVATGPYAGDDYVVTVRFSVRKGGKRIELQVPKELRIPKLRRKTA